jgi:hypothetical protein
MPDERTYGEEEMAEIFKAAAQLPRRTPAAADSTALAPARGLTLAELQSIGGEVGLAPEQVAQAAAALELRRGALRRTDLGLPVSVGRTVDLPRAPTEREWEMIVADLRETFRAKGRTSSHGEVREWNNSRLHAYVEPTPTGYRLRLGTTKGDAVSMNRMGAFGLLFSLVWLVVLFATGSLDEGFFMPLVFALMGSGAIVGNALRLPGWAAEREEQMEGIALRTRALLETAPASAQLAPAPETLVSAG